MRTAPSNGAGEIRPNAAYKHLTPTECSQFRVAAEGELNVACCYNDVREIEAVVNGFESCTTAKDDFTLAVI